MKKIILTFVTAFFIISSVKAVPLTIINDSQTPLFYGEYEVLTYLGFIETGDTCYDSWALPFIFAPNSSLVINNGSFVFQSPFNNYTDCISSILGYAGCPDIALDWIGQRLTDFKPFIGPLNDFVPYEFYPRGPLGLSTGGIDCTASDVSGNVTQLINGTNFYLLQMEYGAYQFLEITYMQFGSVLATLKYE